MILLNAGEVVLGRYRIEKEVFGGGQSCCFRGEDLVPRRPWERSVLIKQYRDSDLAVGSVEANALAAHFAALRGRLGKKKHYLCLPLAVGEANGSVIAVFVYLPSRSLDACMKGGLSQDQRARFALAITNAVRIMHSSGIVHLDLHPGNILLEEKAKTGEPYIRVIDLDAAHIDGVGLRSRVLADPYYKSPEHSAPRRYGNVSEASDVFTLGILLFELLFKQYPFQGMAYQKTVVDSDVRVPANVYHRDVLDRIFACLRPNPRTRPRSAWVHSTLHAHYPSRYEAPESERWTPLYVQLHSNEFKRTCDRSIHLGSRNFRGSGLTNLPPRFLRLWLESKRASAELSDGQVDVRLSGHRLDQDVLVPLNHRDVLTIGGMSFEVRIGKQLAEKQDG